MFIHHLLWKTLSIALLLLITTSEPTNSTDLLWPKPTGFTMDSQGLNLKLNPCDISYKIDSAVFQVRYMLETYLHQVLRCTSGQGSNISMKIIVNHAEPILPTNTSHEEYSLFLDQDGSKWTLQSQYYAGFLRGLQTFSQLLEKQKNKQEWEIKGLPIMIKDRPEFSWRGLMIDTSRHFLDLDTIEHTLWGMLFNKLNVLHWHIIDEDSFPYEIPSVPELSQAGKVGGVYTSEDITSVIKAAKYLGIRVVPEIDTPAHTDSWGRSSKYANITVNCDGIYDGQFDPTLPLTWQVVEKVMRHTESLFNDEYVHFGGDEVEEDCWDQRPAIKEFMKQEGIATYKDLSIWYRRKQKNLWKSISSRKKVIYWANQDIDLPLDDEDAIQWWGVSENTNRLSGRKNPVILSTYDQTYLDVGFGDPFGDHYLTYKTWRDVYGFQPRIPNVNVIGGEAAMWAQLTNKYVYDQKVVQRSAVLGERLWNDGISIHTDLRNIATRLNTHRKRMKERGFKMWPVTVGLCQKDISKCF